MTNEEAIANINMIRVAFVDPVTKEQRKLIDDTLDTAIKALEQQPCDAISRDAVRKILAKYHLGESRIVEELNELPSVQRTSNADKKHVENTLDDAISRQAVLDIDFKRIILTTAKPAETIEQKVKALPPVAPKQKGHWDHGKEISREYRGQTLVNINYLDWYCSNCHCVVEQSIKPEWSYCPNCGAKMVDPQESEEV